MKRSLRILAGIVAGMLLAFILVIAVETVSAVVYPLPKDFGGTQEEMCAHVARYPTWVLAVVVPAWAATALAATWVAQRIGNLFSSTTVGLLLFAALALNVSMLPYPDWFTNANLIAVPAATIIGIRLSIRGKTKTAV